MPGPLVDIKNLSIFFKEDDAQLTAVDKISFYINEKETVGLVGESGCGKTLTTLALMGLVPRNGTVVAQHILFQSEDLMKKTPAEMRELRGDRLTMIFQEPMTSLNPVLSIGFQMNEVLKVHRGLNKMGATKQSITMLEKVGIASPRQCLRSYPHELSGGMRQRVMIAMALLCEPQLLIADEPTTALDVTIQAQILELISRLKKEIGTSILLVTHDLGVIAETCDRVAVMYAGEIVEQAPVKELFSKPFHPYTRGLMRAIPRIERMSRQLYVIPGTVPALDEMPLGCKFHPRCDEALDLCFEQRPPLFFSSDRTRCVSCWRMAEKENFRKAQE